MNIKKICLSLLICSNSFLFFADELKFVGDTLYTQEVTEGGTYIDNFSSNDINRLVFIDDTSTERTFPYTATLTVNFGDNLVNDTNSKYWIYFTTNPSGNYGSASGCIVQDADGGWMSGQASGSVIRTFAYDTNVQGGRSAEEDAEITAVAIGLGTAQFVKAGSTITESTANSVSLVSPLERNYQNPT